MGFGPSISRKGSRKQKRGTKLGDKKIQEAGGLAVSLIRNKRNKGSKERRYGAVVK